MGRHAGSRPAHASKEGAGGAGLDIKHRLHCLHGEDGLCCVRVLAVAAHAVSLLGRDGPGLQAPAAAGSAVPPHKAAWNALSEAKLQGSPTAWRRSTRLPAAQGADACTAQAAGSSRPATGGHRSCPLPRLLSPEPPQEASPGLLVVASIQAAGDDWLAPDSFGLRPFLPCRDACCQSKVCVLLLHIPACSRQQCSCSSQTARPLQSLAVEAAHSLQAAAGQSRSAGTPTPCHLGPTEFGSAAMGPSKEQAAPTPST